LMYNFGTSRRSLRTTSTAQVPLHDMMRVVMTVGVDAWQNLRTGLSMGNLPSLTGTLTPVSTGAVSVATTIRRQPGHNAGGFLQAQVGLWDQMFLTYGMRAEWNPFYGDEAQPNVAPRYGVAYTRAWGSVTTKMRASYGRST